MNSIEYYNKNSKSFYDRSINGNMDDCYRKLFQCIPKQSRILDAGCGVGRDSKVFLDHGYEVEAFDGSIEMVKMASKFLGRDVTHAFFEDFTFLGHFNAVWANASLLHVPYENLRAILHRLHQALLPSGILYASFKHGNSMRQVEDRFFFDMDTASILPYLRGLFQPLEILKSADTRSSVAPSPDKCWLHVLAKRIDP